MVERGHKGQKGCRELEGQQHLEGFRTAGDAGSVQGLRGQVSPGAERHAVRPQLLELPLEVVPDALNRLHPALFSSDPGPNPAESRRNGEMEERRREVGGGGGRTQEEGDGRGYAGDGGQKKGQGGTLKEGAGKGGGADEGEKRARRCGKEEREVLRRSAQFPHLSFRSNIPSRSCK